MRKVCSNIYREMGYNLIIKDLMDCLNPPTFCLACCTNYIGAGHLD
jgi:hypothetical protein